MPRRIALSAPAKLNLFLEVHGRRPDGYHEIRTVMHPIGLEDELEFRARRRRGVVVEGDTSELGEGNLIVRAARVLERIAGRALGAAVRVRKRIPVGAGLGGGSSDAAATIRALAALHRLDLEPRALSDAAAAVGSDVAFFLEARTALCTGRGERVVPLIPAGRLNFVLVLPDESIATPRVYAAFKLALTRFRKDASQFLRFWSERNLAAIGGALFNRLEQPAFKLAPRLKALKRRMIALEPLGVLMSGSGSSLFALCRSRPEAAEMAGAFSRRFVRVRVRVVQTSSSDLVRLPGGAALCR
jgi:4-diphosphocytidyl-2-C-methyl-D-erythritol kinase